MGSLQLLAIMNEVAMNIIEMCPCCVLEFFFGYMHNSAIARSPGKIISNFLRNCQIDF